MGVDTGVKIIEDDFVRPLTLSTTPEGGTGWTVKDTSAAGAPTFTTIDSDSGQLKITLEATDEIQVVTMYHNDIESFLQENIQSVSWDVLVAGIDLLTVLSVGIASDQADDEDAITESAWFKMEGATSTSNLVVESDDGTNDNNDVATGQTLAGTLKRLEINFEFGVEDVRFYVEDSNGQRVRVADGTTFDLSNFTGRLQPFIQLSKPSGTGIPSVTIDNFRIQYKKD